MIHTYRCHTISSFVRGLARISQDSVFCVWRHTKYHRLIMLILIFLAHCASLDINVENKKSENYEIDKLPKHWAPVKDTLADNSYWSKKTGATILINSLCEKYGSASLFVLTQNILRGIDDLNTEVEEEITLAERKALHTVATGKIDGVSIKTNIYIMRKDYCIYDFTYQVKEESYPQDVGDFEKFVKSFRTK